MIAAPISLIPASSQRFLASALVLCAFVDFAAAAWPTDPATPLVIGAAEGIFGERQSVVVTDDQAIWISWQDSFCGGSLRVQRITPDGVLLNPVGIDAQEDPTCGFLLPPVIVSSHNAVVVTRAQSASSIDPIQSYTSGGDLRWPSGFSTPDVQTIGTGLEMDNADVLLTSSSFGGNIHVDRINENGQRVWTSQSVFFNDAGSNFRLIESVPDGLDGAYIFWDSPTPYRRLARVNRINADGKLAWEESVQIFGTNIFNNGSRHTPPVAISDSQGGAVFIWSKGQETGTTPVPVLMQRFDQSGAMSFPVEGARVSLGTRRQFDAAVQQDPKSSDLLVVWRDGQNIETAVRAQRITLAGDRLWGDEGIEIAHLSSQNDSFAPLWIDNQLAVAIADSAGARIHRVDATGAVLSEPWIIGSAAAASTIDLKASSGGIVATWQRDELGNTDSLVAQRINTNGLLGGAMCNPADFSADGVLDIFDVLAFINAFNDEHPAADFTGDSVFDIFDVLGFIDAFNAGCP